MFIAKPKIPPDEPECWYHYCARTTDTGGSYKLADGFITIVPPLNPQKIREFVAGELGCDIKDCNITSLTKLF